MRHTYTPVAFAGLYAVSYTHTHTCAYVCVSYKTYFLKKSNFLSRLKSAVISSANFHARNSCRSRQCAFVRFLIDAWPRKTAVHITYNISLPFAWGDSTRFTHRYIILCLLQEYYTAKRHCTSHTLVYFVNSRTRITIIIIRVIFCTSNGNNSRKQVIVFIINYILFACRGK